MVVVWRWCVCGGEWYSQPDARWSRGRRGECFLAAATTPGGCPPPPCWCYLFMHWCRFSALLFVRCCVKEGEGYDVHTRRALLEEELALLPLPPGLEVIGATQRHLRHIKHGQSCQTAVKESAPVTYRNYRTYIRTSRAVNLRCSEINPVSSH